MIPQIQPAAGNIPQRSRSTTSISCSIGLRSGNCGAHLHTVNSLPCSRYQFEMIWTLWHVARKSHQKMGTVSKNWYKAGWIHAFMFFLHQILTLPSKLNGDSSDQVTFFHPSIPLMDGERRDIRSLSHGATFFQSSFVNFVNLVSFS